jgi:mannose-6-phosphate isomerase-like protein (cupin superfamily)
MPGHEIKRIDDMEAIAFGTFKRARAELGISAFGLQVIDMPPNADAYPEHDHADDGQEEVYFTLSGQGEIEIEGERYPLDSESMVRVSSGTTRKVWTGDEAIRLVIIGGAPGKVYEAPENTVLGGPDPFEERLRQAAEEQAAAEAAK